MYNNDNSIERLLMIDSIEKRKAGRGISARASRKKGFKGGVKFPSDNLTKKELKDMNGELRIMNAKTNFNTEDLKTYNELIIEDPKKLFETINYLKKNFSVAELAKKLDATYNQINNFISRYKAGRYDNSDREKRAKAMESAKKQKETLKKNKIEEIAIDDITLTINDLKTPEKYIKKDKEPVMKYNNTYVEKTMNLKRSDVDIEYIHKALINMLELYSDDESIIISMNIRKDI